MLRLTVRIDGHGTLLVTKLFSPAAFAAACSRCCQPRVRSFYDHRRTWIRDSLELLAGLFGVEIAAFAVLSNHVHVILRNLPDKVCRCLPEKNTWPSRRRQPMKTRGDLRSRCRRAAMAGSVPSRWMSATSR